MPAYRPGKAAAQAEAEHGITNAIKLASNENPLPPIQSIVDAVTGGEDVSRAAEPRLYNLLENLCISRGIPMPKLKVIDTDVLNAFASGMNQRQYSVTVTRGLLDNLDDKEVEAVLGHEIAHVANGDMVTLTLIQGVVNTFVVFLARVAAFFVDRIVFRTERGNGPGYFITMIVAQILLGVLASLIVAWFSRRREFRADAGSAQYLGSPEPMTANRPGCFSRFTNSSTNQPPGP